MKINPSGARAATGHVYPEIVYDDLRRLARRLCRRTRTEYLEDDVIQAGALGLIEASIRFDPKRQVPFGAYARRRVEGAMHDELRRYMPTSKPRPGHVTSAVADVADVIDEIPDSREPVELQLAHAMDLLHLRCALQRLSEAEGAIIIAVYDLDESDTSGASLARALGKSRSHVSRGHLKVMHALRKSLGVGSAHG